MTDLPTLSPASSTDPSGDQKTGLLGGMSFRMAEAVGVGATLASGWIAAWNGIRENFYKNVSRYKVFDDIRMVRDAAHKRAYDSFAGKRDKEGLIREITAIEATYSAEVGERMRGLGISNTIDRWRTLKTHQKSEVAVAVFGVCAILLGAVVNLSASHRIREEQEQLQEKISENGTTR